MAGPTCVMIGSILSSYCSIRLQKTIHLIVSIGVGFVKHRYSAELKKQKAKTEWQPHRTDGQRFLY